MKTLEEQHLTATGRLLCKKERFSLNILFLHTKRPSQKWESLFIFYKDYLEILATTPAPTVRPPSRIAKR